MDAATQIDFQHVLALHGTGNAVVARIHDQLSKVTGKKVPQAVAIVLRHWSDPPYYGGWHSWNMGFESWKYSAQMVRPFRNADIFTCGEAFSSEQGWIEGALKSAERVLRRLDVPVPDWVDADAYGLQCELWG